MKCSKCQYEWVPRVPEPKECPECKKRLKLNKGVLNVQI